MLTVLNNLPSDTVLVIDLDHTLACVNTTFDFIKFLCPVKYLIFSILFKPISLLNTILRRDLYKFLLAAICVKQFKQRDLGYFAKVYYKLLKANSDKYLNRKILKLLQKDINAYKILLTASLDLIANNFKELGFDMIISTKSYYRNERLISFTDLYRRKNNILKILLKHFNKAIVVDDDPEPNLFVNSKVRIIRVKQCFPKIRN